MKKFLVTLSIVLMSMTMVFAGSGTGASDVQTGQGFSNTNSIQATTELSLNVTANDLEYFVTGFTTDNTGDWTNNDLSSSLPSPAGSIPLELDTSYYVVPTTATYVYYKVRTVRAFDLSMTADGPLTNTTQNIHYTVTMGEGSPAVDTEALGTPWELQINHGENHGHKAIAMTIKSKAPVPADFSGKFTSTLTLKLTVRE